MTPSNSKPAATRGLLANDPTEYSSHGWRTTTKNSSSLTDTPPPFSTTSTDYHSLQTMQILSLRIAPIIAAVSFTFAIPAALADPPVYGIPTGSTISVNTGDTHMATWPPGDPLNPLNKKHYQIRADKTYTAESINLYPPGFKFDPHGAIGIRRYFQQRTQGTYSLGAPSSIDVLAKDMPANSRFNQAQYIQDFGPYAPNESTFTASTLKANAVYGVETIALVFVDGDNKTTVLDYQKIDIYPPMLSDAGTLSSFANYFVQNFKQKTALNTPGSTAPTKYAGDPPRVFMNSSQTIYPGATTWVVIYPGNARTTLPTGLAPIPYTSATAPLGDMSERLNIYIDSGNYVTGPGTYTLQFMQQSVYGTETFGNPASFTINNSYKVTSQLGLVK
jgi:hypothetical protein